MRIFSKGYLASYPVPTRVGRRGKFFHSFRRKLFFFVPAAHLKDKEMVLFKKVFFFFSYKPTSVYIGKNDWGLT